VSRELCGGTHVSNTAEIGLFRILSESALASGVRRIEAATGPGALSAFREESEALREAAVELRATPREVPERVRRLLSQVKGLEKEVAEAKRRSAKDLVSEVAAQARTEGGVSLVAARVEAMDAPSLRELADAVKGRMGSGLLLLATVEGDRCHLVAAVSADLAGRFSASDVVKKAAAHVGGGGGGRKDMAQAGGGKLDGLAAALASLSEWVR
jgi:alanyl-tRNA synthetase